MKKVLACVTFLVMASPLQWALSTDIFQGRGGGQPTFWRSGLKKHPILFREFYKELRQKQTMWLPNYMYDIYKIYVWYLFTQPTSLQIVNTLRFLDTF